MGVVLSSCMASGLRSVLGPSSMIDPSLQESRSGTLPYM